MRMWRRKLPLASNATLLTVTTVLFSSCLVGAELVLDESLLALTLASAELSEAAFATGGTLSQEWKHAEFFTSEPDQAVVAKKSGYCFVAFRGTTLRWADWLQNSPVGTRQACVPDAETGSQEVCCTTREGFWGAYNADYKDQLESTVRDCASSCTNKDECVVLTGHSQGASIAAVAALYLADLNPYVITFGQPVTIQAPCPLVTSDRWYRFVNTKASETLNFGIVYDPVPFLPGSGASHFGYMILLGDDNSGVASIGLDAQDYFGPPNVLGFQAHTLSSSTGSEYPGYLQRMSAIAQYYAGSDASFPVRSSGYVAGSLCTEDTECETQQCTTDGMFSYARCVGPDCAHDDDCTTGRCDSGVCLPQLGSCESCNEDSDCASGTCTWLFRCSGDNGLMDDRCYCGGDGDCHSGRCEGLVPRLCESQLSAGASCNEDSDCLSGSCSWRFQCVDTASSNPVVMEVSPDGKARSLRQYEETAKQASRGDDDDDDDSGGSGDSGKVSSSLDDDVTGANPFQKAQLLEWCAAGGLAAFLATLVGWRCVQNAQNRRRRYDEIPTELTV